MVVTVEDLQAEVHGGQLQALHSLLVTGNLSDCKIKCGMREWNTHRFVLCGQSAFFKGALEGNFQEAQQGVVDLSAENAEVLHYLIDLMYGKKFKCGSYTRVDLGSIYALALRLQVSAIAARIRHELPGYIEYYVDEEEYDGLLEDLAELVQIAYNELTESNNPVKECLLKAVLLYMETWSILREGDSDFLIEAFKTSPTFCFDILARIKTTKTAIW